MSEAVRRFDPIAPNVTPFEAWKETVQNTAPELMGQARVVDRGLSYFSKGELANGTVFESTVDDLDGYQIKLNAKGVHNIHRAYKLALLDGNKILTGTKNKVKMVTVNMIATRTVWPDAPVKFKLGDVLDIHVWRDGEYVQYGLTVGGAKS